jgi:hypothetical protein
MRLKSHQQLWRYDAAHRLSKTDAQLAWVRGGAVKAPLDLT